MSHLFFFSNFFVWLKSFANHEELVIFEKDEKESQQTTEQNWTNRIKSHKNPVGEEQT